MSRFNTKQVIKNSVIFVMLLITIAAWIPAIMASMREFYAGMKFADTSFVGFENYRAMIDNDNILNVFRNSFEFAVFPSIVGGIIAFLFTWIIKKLPKWGGVAILSIIALCAGMSWTIFLLSPGVFNSIAEPICQMLILYVLYEAIAWLPFWLVFTIKGENKDYIKLIAVFVLIRIIMLFSTGAGEVYLMHNPMTKGSVETLSTWLYSLFRINGDYCNSMALAVIALVCSLPMALIFAVIVHMLFKNRIGFFRCLMYALIIAINNETVMQFFMRAINGFYAVEGLGYDIFYALMRLLPYIAIMMLMWELTGNARETAIPAFVILAVRTVVSYSTYKNAVIGAVARNVYNDYEAALERQMEIVTSVDLGNLTLTLYTTICVALALLCMISIWVSALINRKK